jgi:hypothetical protein
MTRPKKPTSYLQSPPAARHVEEPFDFEAERAKLKKMTDTELRIYGNEYAKLVKAHSQDSRKWHDIYRLELAKLEYRSRHCKR